MSAIDNLLAIGDVSSPLVQAVVDTIAAGKVSGSQLVGNPAWAVGQALRDGPKGTFGAYLNTVDQRELKALRLGKKSDALVVEAEKLHRELDRHAYGPPALRFAEADVDQARAAGVLIEFAGSRDTAIITDQAVYRELAKQTIKRTVEDLRARVTEKGKTKRSSAAQRARTPRDELDTEHRANLRELTRQAHGTNLDLGAHLLNDLIVVAPDDMDVARFFAYGLLGRESSSFMGKGSRCADDRGERAAARARGAPRHDDADAEERQAGCDEGRLRRRRGCREVAVAVRRRREDRRRSVRPGARRVRRPALRLTSSCSRTASAAARRCPARTRTSRARRLSASRRTPSAPATSSCNAPWRPRHASYAKSLEDLTKRQLEEHAALAVTPRRRRSMRTSRTRPTTSRARVDDDLEVGEAGD